MADEKIEQYWRADAPLPKEYDLWPLHGAGFENLGDDGHMRRVPLRHPGPDELLVRHDAVGICFSDIKVLRTGQNHPRIHTDMRVKPVVLGHEVTMTVVEAGENLRDHYKVGDRFIIQADIYLNGIANAYGYELPGGFQQYNIIDQRVLNGDHGNYLLPVQHDTGYAEAALNEPWACVVASYLVDYRSTWKPGGSVWIVGGGSGVTLGEATEWSPATITLDVNARNFRAQVEVWAQENGIAVAKDEAGKKYDDIVVLSSDPDLIEAAFKRLANGGTFAIVTPTEVERTVQLDIGRIHYDNLALMGTPGPDISLAYAQIRAELKPGGMTLAVGAGGPMGQMHVQRALELKSRPRMIVASERNMERLAALLEKYGEESEVAGVKVTPFGYGQYASSDDADAALMALTGGKGYDDVVVLAPTAAAAEASMRLIGDNGIMVIFAGLPRGTMAAFDVNGVIHRNVRFTGTSGSSIADLKAVLDLVESNQLATNRSVAAVAGLEGLPDGLHAVADGKIAGKIVIYPQIQGLPLTPLGDLKNALPNVSAKLTHEGVWTNEAEEELLSTYLREPRAQGEQR